MKYLDVNNLSCYTVGHSNHDINHLIRLLEANGVNCLVDVRSSPYSKFTPQFNKEFLEKALKERNILYVYLGDKLGGRYRDPKFLFSNGIVDYNKVVQDEDFCIGVNKVITNISKGLVIALMCAEKNPLDCHRFLLVARALSRKSITVKHILEDGNFILNEDLERLLLRKYKNDTDQISFLQENSPEKSLDEAYQKRNQEVGFVAERTTEQ